MDEEEFLTQMAAGTDIPTAWAASEQDGEPSEPGDGCLPSLFLMLAFAITTRYLIS